MPSRPHPQAAPKATEARLQQIKSAAAEAAAANGKPLNHPQIQGRDAYYDLPALKPPVWTWQVPLYFFLGGISGVSACAAFAAQLFHGSASLIRLLLWIGLIGAAICPALLIADLGRPTRFLNMLRVFKRLDLRLESDDLQLGVDLLLGQHLGLTLANTRQAGLRAIFGVVARLERNFANDRDVAFLGQ